MVLVATAGMTGGCATAVSYVDPAVPRFAGLRTSALPLADDPAALRIVTFNIKYARQIDSAIALLSSDTALRTVDVLLLQEMDSAGTARIAEALGLHWVYYPATLRASGRDFGNAVLSRWQIRDDRRIQLPHPGRFGAGVRSATAATVEYPGEPLRVYSVHLGTMVNTGPGGRRNQLRAVLADAEPYERVIIGGDFNQHGVPRVATSTGYLWPTEHGPRTAALGRWDHILLRGLVADSARTGTVIETRGSSDHRPVWTTAY